VDNAEARTRVLQLYKAWYRHIPTMVNEFDIPVNVAKSRDLLRDKFRSNAHIKDTRVIDMLVVKVNIFQMSNHFYLQWSHHFTKNPYAKYTIFVLGPTRSTRSRWSLGSSTAHYVETFQRSCKRSTERFYGEVFEWSWLAVKRLSRRYYHFSAFVMKQQYCYGVRNWRNELVSLLDHSGDTHYCQFTLSCNE